MSGQWKEEGCPLTSLIVLDHALDSLSDKSFGWVERPAELNELRMLDSKLDEAQNIIHSLIEQAATIGIDSASLETALEGDDEQLFSIMSEAESSSGEISRLWLQITNSINDLNSLVSRKGALLDALENNLPPQLRISTPHRSKSKELGGISNIKHLNRQIGRYRAKEWQSDPNYGSTKADFSWMKTLSGAYESSRSHLRGRSRKLPDIAAHESVLRKLEAKRRQADATSIKASEEQLRRDRDKALQGVFKKFGYIMKRKVKGKKVEYVFQHYE